MAAQFGFVVHAAQAQPFELAAEGASNRLAERGFADAGGSDETKNRRLGGRIEFQDAQVLEYALLHFAQIIVVFVQNLPGARDIQYIFRRHLPRQLE